MIRTTNNLFNVISVLFSNKNLTYHEISRRTKLSVMGVSKIINKLTESGIVNVERIGKSKIPKLILDKKNLEIFVLAERFRFNEFADNHKGLKGFLLTLKDNFDSDFSLVFGSYASGEESTKSDLDLLIVSNKDNVNVLNKAKSLISIEINPMFIKKKDFIAEFKKRHRLYNEIVNGKRILINGEYAFWELVVSL
jgi:predicted nucleotidyltransferase